MFQAIIEQCLTMIWFAFHVIDTRRRLDKKRTIRKSILNWIVTWIINKN